MLSLSDCSTEHVSEMNGQFMRVDENYHSYAQDSTKITIFFNLDSLCLYSQQTG